MTTVTSSFNWANWVLPPLFVASEVVINDVFVKGYHISDPVVLVDLGLYVTLYLLSDIVVQFGLDKIFTSSTSGSGEDLLQSGTDIVIQPALEGLFAGLIRPMIHSQQTLISHPITFLNSFIDGMIYNITAKYLSSPIVFYFENN